MALIYWTGLGADDKWSTVANWTQDPTIGGPHQIELLIADTSTLDTDMGEWEEPGVTHMEIDIGHTFILAPGGVITTNGIFQWEGLVKFEGGTLGNPFFVSASPRLQNGTVEFHGGIFQAVRSPIGANIYIARFENAIHVIGKTAGADFNPAYFHSADLDTASFQFTMVAGEGVDKISLDSPIFAFREKYTGTGPVTLTVDGIQDYIDGGGTQLEWVLRTSDIVAPNATRDLTLVQSGPVDGGFGTVTATYNRVVLNIGISPQSINPMPPNVSTDVPQFADLSWTNTDPLVNSYDVYFGEDTLEFQGNQPDETFDPGTLNYGTTYVWRIDSVADSGTTTGAVWSFTTVRRPIFPEDARRAGDGVKLYKTKLQNIGVVNR